MRVVGGASVGWVRCAVAASFVALAAALGGAPTRAQDAGPADAFSFRFGGRMEVVETGPDGTVYCAGFAEKRDLPGSVPSPVPESGAGSYDAFVAALAPDGTPRWTSYVPVASYGYGSWIRALAPAPDGSVWAVGTGRLALQGAEGLPASAGESWDGLVAKFGPDGTLLFSGALGGSGYDWIADVATTADGDAVVVGNTDSTDFPGAPAPSGGSGDAPTAGGFIARIAADGSSVRWVRRFGSPPNRRERLDLGVSVAVDPADDSVISGLVCGPHALGPFDVADLTDRSGDSPSRSPIGSRATTIVRWSPDGTPLRAVRLPGVLAARRGWPVEDAFHPSLALDAAGRILVGAHGRVRRLDRAMTRIEATNPVGPPLTAVLRIAPVPGGAIVAECRPGRGFGGREVVALGGRGERRARTLLRSEDLGFAAIDVAIGPAGALSVVGPGDAVRSGTALVAPGTGDGCVAQVPLGGARPPSRMSAVAVAPGVARVRWRADGDPVVGWEVESVALDGTATVVGAARPEERTCLAEGLRPGENRDLRLVAVFSSGARTATPRFALGTPPVPPAEVHAVRSEHGRVEIGWKTVDGDDTRWSAERRVGDGPWIRLGERAMAGRRTEAGLTAVDVLPDLAVPVTYRVTAYLSAQRGWSSVDFRSDATESAPLPPSATLAVSQSSGSLRRHDPAGQDLVIECRVAAAAGGALPGFDPATDELRVIYGDARQPSVWVVPPGMPAWSVEADGVFRWSADRTLTGWSEGSEVVLDLVQGTFRIRLVSTQWFVDARSSSIVVGLELGGLAGGDLREWTGRADVPDLRLAPPSAAGSRRR